MSSLNPDMPKGGESLPFRTVEAALRKTTETLARELACPTRRPPEWSDFEWRIAEAVAAMHGVSALLARELRWQGPEHWRRFLVEQKIHTLRRQRLIEQLLDALDSRGRRAGIGLVALKGAELHTIGIYGAGERPMADIDLLVREADADAVAGMIVALGYSEYYANWRHRVFAPEGKKGHVAGFGENVANPIKIELHTRIAVRLPLAETDITSLAFPRNPQPGLNHYPSVASLMTHLLLHAADNMRDRALRLVQLHDIALLATRMDGHDWEDLHGGPEGARDLWWILPPLTLVARYYPAAIPRALVSGVEQACPWLLRQCSRRYQLAEVSWSNLRMQVFPGIEWCRSPREVLSFVMGRIRSSPTARAAVDRVATNDQWAARISWYGLPRRKRILRWIFSRPPRIGTLWSVRSALGLEP